MRGIWRPLLVIGLALLVPIVPFLALGESLDARVAGVARSAAVAATVALVTVGVLAVDVLLPVPSSLVSTFAGARLGVAGRHGSVVAGLTAGAIAGFWLARVCGRPLAARLSSQRRAG